MKKIGAWLVFFVVIVSLVGLVNKYPGLFISGGLAFLFSFVPFQWLAKSRKPNRTLVVLLLIMVIGILLMSYLMTSSVSLYGLVVAGSHLGKVLAAGVTMFVLFCLGWWAWVTAGISNLF